MKQRREVTRKSPALESLKEGIVLFYGVEAGVSAHYSALMVVAKTLQQQGHRVLFARCTGLFPRCTVLDSTKSPQDLTRIQFNQVCQKCVSTSINALESYGLEGLDLRQFLKDEHLEITRKIVETAPRDLRDITFDGFQFGKMCLMNVSLANKIANCDDVDDSVRRVWLRYVETSILSYLLVKELCRQVKVTALVHYNDYSINLGARLAADAAGARVTSLAHRAHRNIDRRFYLFTSTVWSEQNYRPTLEWSRWRGLSLSVDQVNEVTEDLITRFQGLGSHNYSPTKTNGDIHSQLGLSKERKLLVAFTSSLDEINSSWATNEGLGLAQIPAKDIFLSQVEWLVELGKFVENNPDMQLVVRVHPREGKNKRDQQTSQHLGLLLSVFRDNSERVRFVWPEDKISSYDLAEMADLTLVSWSTIANELARLAIPVLATNVGNGLYPVDDFIEWLPHRTAYFRRIRELIDAPLEPSVERLARAYRAYYLFHLGSAVDLRDVIPHWDFADAPPFKMPAEGPLLEEVVLRGANLLDVNFTRMASRQSPANTEAEFQAIRRGLTRIMGYVLFGGHHVEIDDSFFEKIEIKNSRLSYPYNGKVLTRYSPLLTRLIQVCCPTHFTLPLGECRTQVASA